MSDVREHWPCNRVSWYLFFHENLLIFVKNYPSM